MAGPALGSHLLTVRTKVAGWLARPLTSFQLILAVFGMLCGIGLTMVLSASTVDALTHERGAYGVFVKQVLYAFIGLVLFVLVLRVPPRLMRQISFPATVASVLLLLLVAIPGIGAVRGGARSWFIIGPLSFQPLELAKLALALWGAHVLVVKRALLEQRRHLLVPVVPVALVMCALLMLQPELGGTITIVIVLFALLWFAGTPLPLFGALSLGALSGALLLAVTAGYRSQRVQTFLHPEAADAQGAGYQSMQAMYAMGEGGFFGKGLGQSSSKYLYLPNAHNDFIFAVIGEELGMIGCAVVVLLFAVLAYTGLRIAARNTDPWIRLVSAVITVWIVSQAVINIGYVIGLLPVTGLTLPLISSGGTSMVSTMVCFGVLANFARHEPACISALKSGSQGRIAKLLRLPVPDPYRPPMKRRPQPITPPPLRGRPPAPGGGRR
ncbi:putative lipid II flippase FtsW [Pseudonocardiaceae bacterium YIM PH 21723]|nr:putative lipid II flippase FtsW [Pseudonocardiaceae bacterium YIM PH 21723]